MTIIVSEESGEYLKKLKSEYRKTHGEVVKDALIFSKEYLEKKYKEEVEALK